MTARDRSLRDDLTTVADVYRQWANDLATIPARAWTGSRTGKPSSRPPAGRDSEAAAALVKVCRLAADLHGLYGGTWEPTSIGRRHGFVDVPKARWDRDTLVLSVRTRGEWTPDPDDVTLVLPDVGEVRYALLGCEALCNRQIDQRRSNALSIVGSMEWTLKGVKMWPPDEDEDPVACAHCLERRAARDGEWCWWCQRAHETGASCAVCGYAA